MDVATTCSHGPGPLTVTHHHAQFSPLFDSIHFVAFLVPSIPPLARLYNAAYVSESLDSTIAWSCLPFANSISHSLCPFASNCCRAPSPLEHYRHLYVPRSPSISAAHSYSTSWNDHRFLWSPSGSWARRVLCARPSPESMLVKAGKFLAPWHLRTCVFSVSRYVGDSLICRWSAQASHSCSAAPYCIICVPLAI